MKRIISIILAIVLFGTANICTYALDTEIEGLSEKLDALFVQGKFTEGKRDELMQQWEQRQRDRIIESINLGAPWEAIEKPYRGEINFENKTREEKIDLIVEYLRPDFNTGVLVSCLDKYQYINQYAQSGCFEYMFSGKKYWEIFRNNSVVESVNLYENGSYIENWREFCPNSSPIIIVDKTWDFLKNEREIAEMLQEVGENAVNDIRLFKVSEMGFLYIKCKDNGYLIKVRDRDLFKGVAETPEIENFKLYTVKEMAYKLYEHRYKSEKPTYETEAIALQNAGLLYGNEKGLDLLKPLTRIEATTLLVRAMGYEDATTSETSYFADIASDNWGAKYANIACDKGIAEGVGDNRFAPDERITASQFATLILRNCGEDPDWQTAINTFVERGLITAEQAETMDLFTRGDMAKLIYEARAKNIL